MTAVVVWLDIDTPAVDLVLGLQDEIGYRLIVIRDKPKAAGCLEGAIRQRTKLLKVMLERLV